MKRTVYLLFVISWMFACSLHAFDKVVIWGHKLHSHTHSYIHYGFAKAFKYMGHKVYWFDDADHPQEEEFDYSNTLFLTASAVDHHIPLREDCSYIYHHCWDKSHRCVLPKYEKAYDEGRCVTIKCFSDDYLKEENDWEKVDICIYKSIKYKEVIFPWATDLLPHEIEIEKKHLNRRHRRKNISYIGTISNIGEGANEAQLKPFIQMAKKHRCKIYTHNPWVKPLSNRQHKLKIQKSYMAPAIQGAWQCKRAYIPCRIFKNISYGQLGITNSKYVHELFEGKIVYNSDTAQLFLDAKEALKTHTIDKQKELMDFVKEKHTYLQRVELLLQFLEELQNK